MLQAHDRSIFSSNAFYPLGLAGGRSCLPGKDLVRPAIASVSCLVITVLALQLQVDFLFGIYAPETGADEIRDQTHARVNGKYVCDFTREGSKGKEKEDGVTRKVLKSRRSLFVDGDWPLISRWPPCRTGHDCRSSQGAVHFLVDA